jgi:hypothetical protein
MQLDRGSLGNSEVDGIGGVPLDDWLAQSPGHLTASGRGVAVMTLVSDHFHRRSKPRFSPGRLRKVSIKTRTAALKLPTYPVGARGPSWATQMNWRL